MTADIVMCTYLCVCVCEWNNSKDFDTNTAEISSFLLRLSITWILTYLKSFIAVNLHIIRKE